MKRISAAFDIKRGEGWAVGLLLLLSLTMGAAVVFAETGATVLFLDRFGAQNLPYVYLASAAVIGLIGFFFSKIEAKTSARASLVGSVALLFVTAFAFRAALNLLDAPWVAFALLVWFRLLYVLSGLVMWGLAGRLFNLRQGKRLFGLVGSGEMVSAILGYFSIPFFVHLWGTTNLISVAAASLGIGLLVIGYAVHRFSNHLADQKKPDKVRGSNLAVQKNDRSRYIALMFLVSFLVILAYFFLDFSMSAQSKARFQDPDQLAQFFGFFFGMVSVSRLGSRAFLAPRILKRFGLSTGLFILPATVALGATCIALAGVLHASLGTLFIIVAGARFLESTFRPAIHKTSFLLLYQPLSKEQRLSLQSKAETMVEPLAMAAAGAALLFFNARGHLSVPNLALVLLVVATAWVVGSIHLYRGYIAALKNALAKRFLGETALSLDDATTARTLVEKLSSQHPAEVLYAMDLLERVDITILESQLPELIHHPSQQVRLSAVTRIEKSRLVSALPALQQRLKAETMPEASAAILWTLGTLCEQGQVHQLIPLLDDSEASIQAKAVIGLLRSRQPEGVSAGENYLHRKAVSPDPGSRELSAFIIGRAGREEYIPLLRALLADESIPVRRAAIQAAGHLKASELWPTVIDCLDRPEVRRAATQALIQGGNPVVPYLRAAFYEKPWEPAGLRRLVSVIGSIGGQEAAAFLEEQIQQADPGLRTEVLKSLRRCGYQANLSRRTVVQEQIQDEIQQAVWIAGILASIGPDKPAPLLQNALAAQANRVIERTFTLLSFLYHPASILSAGDNLKLSQPEKRSYAMEIFDVLLPKELKSPLLPLLEGYPYMPGLHPSAVNFPVSAPDNFDQLETLLYTPDGVIEPWTRACAIYSLGRPPEERFIHTIQSLQSDPSRFVREAASWSLNRQEYDGEMTMLSTLEKVIILKTVSLFSTAPDDLLAELADLVDLVEVKAGQRIFTKGEVGTRMYAIVEGQVRVHDGDQLVDLLSDREVFGEMALLDAEQRTASVTAITDTRVLVLDQEPFFELLEDRADFSRGIIRVLVQRLRARAEDLIQLQKSNASSAKEHHLL